MKEPDQTSSPSVVAAAPGGEAPASDAPPDPAAPNPPVTTPAGATPGRPQQASDQAPAPPAPAAGSGPDKVVLGQEVPPVVPRAFKVACDRDRLTVRQGRTATFDCTLDGWIAVATNVPIWLSPDNPGGGPCDGTEVFSSSPDVIRRSAFQAPTSFTVTVDARSGGVAGGSVKVGTPWESSEDLVEIEVEAAPGDQPQACSPGNQSL